MSKIVAQLVRGGRPSFTTAKSLKDFFECSDEQVDGMCFMVLLVTFKKQKILCCLSGGQRNTACACKVSGKGHSCGSLSIDDISFTAVGQAAFESMLDLVGLGSHVVLQELCVTKAMSIEDKIKRTLENTMRIKEKIDCICFWGDMTGELDGILRIFNLKDKPVKMDGSV